MSEKVTNRQAVLLIMVCRIVTMLTIMPTVSVEPANQDIWIVIIVSFFYTILISIPIFFISNRFNDLNLIGVMGKIFGKFIGKIVGIIYIIFYIMMAILSLYTSVQMIRTSFLPDNKPIITIIILMISCIYFCSKGSVTIGRYAELFAPGLLVILGIFIILGYENVDLSILLPIYKDSTFWNINYGAIKLTYLFLDLNILLMIAPKLEHKEEKNKIFIKSTFYSLIFVLTTVVVTQSALGIEQAKHSNFPFLLYIRLIRAYSIFERVESIYIILWIFAMVIKISAYIHIADEGMKEIFKKESGNKYLYMIGVICVLVTYYFSDIKPMYIEIIHVIDWQYIYSFIHKTGIPLIALLVYFIRRKKIGPGEKLRS